MSFSFIDLFSGIGGMRLAAEAAGGHCVMSSEIDKSAAKVYERNFGEKPYGDILGVEEHLVPDHDMLLAGFPCQPFSICGFKRGFNDARGTLFFEILRIAKFKRPRSLLLENVKHFASHDNGTTLSVVKASLEELGYSVAIKVLNAKDFNLPQSRERTIIVASEVGSFDFEAMAKGSPRKLSDILEEDAPFEFLHPSEYTLLPDDLRKDQAMSGLQFVGYRNRNLRKVGVRPGTEHLSRVHKQPNRIYAAEGTHPTLAAGETSGRYWVLVDGRVRKLTLKECYRLQGFPEAFVPDQRKSAAYKQIGNSVPISMIRAVVDAMVDQQLVGPAPRKIAA